MTDKRVWVVKTHFPQRWGNTIYDTQRAVLLVRNPVDAIVSVFNMVMTNTHSVSIHDDTFVRLSNCWDMIQKFHMQCWVEFTEYWLKSKIPIHIVRFEDIL